MKTDVLVKDLATSWYTLSERRGNKAPAANLDSGLPSTVRSFARAVAQSPEVGSSPVRSVKLPPAPLDEDPSYVLFCYSLTEEGGRWCFRGNASDPDVFAREEDGDWAHCGAFSECAQVLLIQVLIENAELAADSGSEPPRFTGRGLTSTYSHESELHRYLEAACARSEMAELGAGRIAAYYSSEIAALVHQEDGDEYCEIVARTAHSWEELRGLVARAGGWDSVV